MNKIICYNQTTLFSLLLFVFAFALSGCSQDDNNIRTDEQTVAIPIEISGLQVSRLSIEDESHTVNRLLILPFKKLNESITTNEDGNFAPDYTNAKQVDISADVTNTAMLNFVAGSTYKVLVVGYNQNDYDFADQGAAGEKFSVGSATTPALFTNMQLLLASAGNVPEFFSGVCQAYISSTSVGEYFTPAPITSLKATITRLVSGLNMEITNVPDSIYSMTLIAETLVKGIHPISAAATAVELSAAADNLKMLSTQIPVSKVITFSHYLLPTFETNQTKFFLDVNYGTNGVNTKRFPVKVIDDTGVVLNNSIIFSPNDVVKITGDYSKIDAGFTIEVTGLNLDDNAWDGLQ